MTRFLPADSPDALVLGDAIRAGDLATVRAALAADPALVHAAIGDATCARPLLHIATDWPGNFPNGPQMVRLLVDAGADVNGRFIGTHRETALHWAASCDDVPVLDALLDLGADIEADGAVIAGGTPLADATAFGQWHVARRLLEHGAQTTFWEAAAMGLLDRVRAACEGDADAEVTDDDVPDAEDITEALWGACHGGQRETAAYLIERGGDPRWVGWEEMTAEAAARREGHDELGDWISALQTR